MLRTFVSLALISICLSAVAAETKIQTPQNVTPVKDGTYAKIFQTDRGFSIQGSDRELLKFSKAASIQCGKEAISITSKNGELVLTIGKTSVRTHECELALPSSDMQVVPNETEIDKLPRLTLSSFRVRLIRSGGERVLEIRRGQQKMEGRFWNLRMGDSTISARAGDTGVDVAIGKIHILSNDVILEVPSSGISSIKMAGIRL